MTEPFSLVKVVWLDAHGSAVIAYELHEIPHKAIEVVSYGLLLRHDEVGVSIASERCGGSTYRGYTFMPAGMVVRVEPMKRVRVKKAIPAVMVAALAPPPSPAPEEKP